MAYHALLVPVLAAGLAAIGSSPAGASGLLDRAAAGLSGAAEAVGDAARSAGDAIERQVEPTPAAQIDADVDAAFARLLADVPGAQALADQSVAMLVFPTITKGGFMIGGEYGEGAMRQDGETIGYYNIGAISYGLQIGGQQFSYAMFFLNEAALAYFEKNDGWEAGVGPTLVGGREGWSTAMGTNDLQGDIVPVFFGQAGLMAGAGLKGIKISRLSR
jgi:lipid-binding SYLF domain-containing protein